MTKRAKLRCLRIGWVVAALALLGLFTLIANWLTVISRDEAIKRGMSVPSNWRLVTIGLGRHGPGGQCRWPFGTAAENPIAFSMCVIAAVGVVFSLTRIKKHADKLKREITRAEKGIAATTTAPGG